LSRLWGLVVGIAVVAAALSVACGGSDSKSNSSSSSSSSATAAPAPSGPPQVLTLTATEAGGNYGFDPATFTAKPGNVTIRYSNKAGNNRPHTLEIKTSDGKSIIKSDEIDPGKETDVTFALPTAGTYQFICYNPGHADRGQKGTITVS
jgi:plastocyanin